MLPWEICSFPLGEQKLAKEEMELGLKFAGEWIDADDEK